MSNQSKDYFSNMTCVIADPSSGFSGSIKSILMEMGFKNSAVHVSSTFDDAFRMIQSLKPALLVTEYGFNDKNGLALVEELKRQGGSDTICIMITNDSSDSIVAEAAEEQVDAFLIKPFSSGSFGERLKSVIESRRNPSPYQSLIQKGKLLLGEKNYQQALQVFLEAKKLKDKPTLACYYAGFSYQKLNDIENALKEFREGRRYNSIHYLSLFGEFEILVNNKRFKEAYDLVELLQDTFPMTPYRLGQILISILFSGRFDRLTKCYDQMLKLHKRPPELTRVAVQAFLAAGRYHLKAGKKNAALDYYDKSLLIGGRSLDTLEKIVDDLIAAKSLGEAVAFLGKASKTDIGSPDYQKLAYKIDVLTLPTNELIERGRKLIMQGYGNREIYTHVVQMLVNEGKLTLAESIIQRAIQHIPELKQALYQILDSGRSGKQTGT